MIQYCVYYTKTLRIITSCDEISLRFAREISDVATCAADANLDS